MEVETEFTTSFDSADDGQQNYSLETPPKPLESPEAATGERDGQSHQVQPEKIAHPVLPPLTKDSPRIYFQRHSRELRHKSIAYRKKLPPYFYRVTSEKTATPSKYEIEDLHASDARWKIQPGMAFQALERFTFENDITLKRYERHHKQRMKRNPSSYVSVTNKLVQAERISKRFYKKTNAQRARRIIVVKVKTAGLISAEYETDEIAEETGLRRRIPIWIRDTAISADGSPITTREWHNSGADVYLCVLEQRDSGWYVSEKDKHGQYHEYMGCGFIPAKYVAAVMPFDGHIVHRENPDQPIRSELDPDYLFDWDLEQWRFDPIATKRKRPEDEGTDDGPSEKRQGMMKGDKHFDKDKFEVFDDKPTRDSCCKPCGRKTEKEHFAECVVAICAYLDLASPPKHWRKSSTW